MIWGAILICNIFVNIFSIIYCFTQKAWFQELLLQCSQYLNHLFEYDRKCAVDDQLGFEN